MITKNKIITPGYVFYGKPVRKVKVNNIALKRKKISKEKIKNEIIRFKKLIKNK